MARHQHSGLGLVGSYLGSLTSLTRFFASQHLKVGFLGTAERRGLTRHIWLSCLRRSLSRWREGCRVSVVGVSSVDLAGLSMPPFYPACQLVALSPEISFAFLQVVCIALC